MNEKQYGRWYSDKRTGLPTIRKHPDARTYQTPDEVKRLIGGQEPEDAYPIEGPCGLCNGPFHPGRPCARNSRD